MTPERWEIVKEIVAAALELPVEDRPAYLGQHCNGDEEVRSEVERLLASEQEAAADFLGEAHLGKFAAALLPAEEHPWIGRRVGAYRIVEQIGVGGMGEVYRAVRADDQYRMEVALKLVRAGQFDNFAFERFKNERQILAGLDHPNLAKLLDGGTTDEGIPYLVMEFIEGQPIADYCAAKELSIKERLKLFLEVCAAVYYAHRHLIIHRDIKPQNILVTAEGVAKLLDFGIAKIVEPETADSHSDLTVTAFRALTPRYASPEQIRGEAMTTATDIYSLGVVLYELLTGLSPYERTRSSTQELSRIVCEKEITRPSLAIAHDVKAPTTRGFPESSAEKLRKQLNGDLDTIVLMAMRKEPSRRYASVNDLQEDIRRHLENLPVIARNDSVRYRATKFVARHKPGVIAATAVLSILIAGIVITLREAQIARQRFNDVRSLANSLIFDVHDAVRDLPGSTPARKIIVERALQYLNVLAHDSAGDVSLQRELATAYERVGSVQGDYLENNLGDFAGTLVSYQKALELRKQISAASNDWNDRLALAQGYRLVAHQLWANGNTRGARDPIDRAVAVADQINRDHPNTVKILRELAFDLEVSGRIGFPGDSAANDKVIDSYKRAMAADEAALKIEPNDIAILHAYATDLSNVGGKIEASSPEEALKIYQRALEMDLKLTALTTDIRYKRTVAIAYGSIASAYDDMGDFQYALDNNLKSLSIYQDLVHADPKNKLLQQGLAISYANTASSRIRVNQIPAALDDANHGLDLIRPLISSGPRNSFQQIIFAAMLVARGTVYLTAHHPEPAKLDFENSLTVYEALFKAGNTNHAYSAGVYVKLGTAAAQAGHDQDAENDFQQALTVAEPLLSKTPADLDALYAAADAYTGLGDLEVKQARRHGLSPDAQKAAWNEARSWFEQSQKTWQRISHPIRTSPNSFQVGDPADVAKKLKMCDAAIAALH